MTYPPYMAYQQERKTALWRQSLYSNWEQKNLKYENWSYVKYPP